MGYILSRVPEASAVGHFSNYIQSVRASGRYAFEAGEAIDELKISKNAFFCGLYKLRKKGEIITPADGLSVIVPPENRYLGSLPAEELIPLLMKHWGLPYYACLLSAAYYHGASHQKAQVFQVMTSRQFKTMTFGKIHIEFVYKKNLDKLPFRQRVVKTGYLNYSSPELTAMDLLNYRRRSGGLNHIATVLSELVEAMDPRALESLMRASSEKYWIQRLGYILEEIDSENAKHRKNIVKKIRSHLKKFELSWVPLASELKGKGVENKRWKIIENTSIESDL